MTIAPARNHRRGAPGALWAMRPYNPLGIPAGNRRLDPIGIVQPLQDSLRTFLESFPFFGHLEQDFEARLFFCHQPIHPANLLLSMGESRLSLLLLFFRLAQSLS